MPAGTCPTDPNKALIWAYEQLRRRTLDPWAQELAEQMAPTVEKLRLALGDTQS
jgi:hypothetical protein